MGYLRRIEILQIPKLLCIKYTTNISERPIAFFYEIVAPCENVHLSHIFYWLICFQPDFRLRELVFPWYLLRMFNFVHILQYFIFRAYSMKYILSFPKNPYHMQISSQNHLTLVIRKLPIPKITTASIVDKQSHNFLLTIEQ